MRKTLKMRNDREGSHTNRYSETDWEGVSEDVSSEAIFDTVGVVLK